MTSSVLHHLVSVAFVFPSPPCTSVDLMTWHRFAKWGGQSVIRIRIHLLTCLLTYCVCACVRVCVHDVMCRWRTTTIILRRSKRTFTSRASKRTTTKALCCSAWPPVTLTPSQWPWPWRQRQNRLHDQLGSGSLRHGRQRDWTGASCHVAGPRTRSWTQHLPHCHRQRSTFKVITIFKVIHVTFKVIEDSASPDSDGYGWQRARVRCWKIPTASGREPAFRHRGSSTSHIDYAHPTLSKYGFGLWLPVLLLIGKHSVFVCIQTQVKYVGHNASLCYFSIITCAGWPEASFADLLSCSYNCNQSGMCEHSLKRPQPHLHRCRHFLLANESVFSSFAIQRLQMR